MLVQEKGVNCTVLKKAVIILYQYSFYIFVLCRKCSLWSFKTRFVFAFCFGHLPWHVSKRGRRRLLINRNLASLHIENAFSCCNLCMKTRFQTSKSAYKRVLSSKLLPSFSIYTTPFLAPILRFTTFLPACITQINTQTAFLVFTVYETCWFGWSA